LDAFSEDIDSSESEIDDADANHYDPNLILMVSTQIQVNYCAKEQFSEKAAWYNGVVTKVNKQANSSVTYDVTYGDTLERMRRKTRQSTGWEMQVHSELMTIELLP
jgi:hypothetical protein